MHRLRAGAESARRLHLRAAGRQRSGQPNVARERFGFVYEINYLRCIHCDMCVEACPTEAITESKLFEFSFTNRRDAIYTKTELLVDDDGRPQHLPWEDWRDGEDKYTSCGCARPRRRATPTSSGRSAGAASSATGCARRRTADKSSLSPPSFLPPGDTLDDRAGP